MNHSTLGRALVGAVLFLALGGPGPGAVGSCGGELNTVDPVQFCVNRKVRECHRARAGSDPLPVRPTPCVDDPATPAIDESDPVNCNWSYCLELVPTICDDAVVTCSPPSDAVASACLRALESPDRVTEPTDTIAECRVEVICPSGAALTEALEEAPYDSASPDPTASDSAEVP